MVSIYTLLLNNRRENPGLCEIAEEFINGYTSARDRVEYINERVLDFNALVTRDNHVEELHLLLGTGGPILWLIVAEDYYAVIRVLPDMYEYCRQSTRLKEVFDEMVDILAHS